MRLHEVIALAKEGDKIVNDDFVNDAYLFIEYYGIWSSNTKGRGTFTIGDFERDDWEIKVEPVRFDSICVGQKFHKVNDDDFFMKVTNATETATTNSGSFIFTALNLVTGKVALFVSDSKVYLEEEN